MKYVWTSVTECNEDVPTSEIDETQTGHVGGVRLKLRNGRMKWKFEVSLFCCVGGSPSFGRFGSWQAGNQAMCPFGVKVTRETAGWGRPPETVPICDCTCAFLTLGSECERMKAERERGGSHLMQRRFGNLWTVISSRKTKQKQYFRVSEGAGAGCGGQVFSLDSLCFNSLYSSVALCQESETSEVLESLASFLRCLTVFSSSCRPEESHCFHITSCTAKNLNLFFI